MMKPLPFNFGRVQPLMVPPGRWGAKVSLVLLLALVAFLFGAIAALFGGLPAVFLLAVILPLAFTFRDYRVGVVALTILLPWTASPLLPQAQGFNVVNFFTLASTLSFGLHVLLRRRPVVHMPRIVWWCYIVPFSMGLLVAWPHIPEGAVNLGAEHAVNFTPIEFLKGRYIKALFLVLYAFLLANAVRESKRPERWLVVLGAAALLPVMAVGGLISLYRVSLSDLQAARGFLGPLGYHANSMAWLLATVLGPLLFLTAAVRGWARAGAILVSGGVIVALALTFSRGGLLALIAVLVLFAISRKRLTALLLVATIIAAGVAAVPAVRERALTGVEADAVSKATASAALKGDALSAGRIAFWPLLAREVRRSPIWGRGIGSTAWSEAARDGSYRANHPHNLVLAIAMDLGLVGLALMLYLFYRIGRTYARLSREPSLSPPMRAFFAGALASMLGCTLMGVTTGAMYEPLPEQTFVWFSLGLAMAWWHLGQAAPATGGATRRPWVFGIRPMRQRRIAVGTSTRS